MLITSRTIFGVLMLFLVPVILLSVLQIFLSRMVPKWPGLILPVASLVLAGVSTLGLLLYLTAPIPAGAWLSCLYVFALMNIPTLLFLGIYAFCRGKFCRKREIERMNIQDL